jgi:hypothetical protein
VVLSVQSTLDMTPALVARTADRDDSDCVDAEFVDVPLITALVVQVAAPGRARRATGAYAAAPLPDQRLLAIA